MQRKKTVVKKVLTDRQVMQNFVAKRRPTLIGVKKLMKTIWGMVVPAQTRADIINGYKLTPEQIMRKGKIPVLFKGNEPRYGCYQMSSVLYSALKELGLRPRMTRFFVSTGVPHTTIIFSLNGRLYEADTFYGSQLNRVDDVRLKQIKEAQRLKKFKFIKPGQYTKAMYDRERKTGNLAV